MDTIKKRLPIYIAVALAALLTAGGFIAMSLNREKPLSVDELLSLGERYLLDLEYEQALAQFLKVIEIEPMNERGYVGAAEAYIGLGNTSSAIFILEQGLSATGDAQIAVMLAALTEPKLEPETEPSSGSLYEAQEAGHYDVYFEFLDEQGNPYEIKLLGISINSGEILILSDEFASNSMLLSDSMKQKFLDEGASQLRVDEASGYIENFSFTGWEVKFSIDAEDFMIYFTTIETGYGGSGGQRGWDNHRVVELYGENHSGHRTTTAQKYYENHDTAIKE